MKKQLLLSLTLISLAASGCTVQVNTPGANTTAATVAVSESVALAPSDVPAEVATGAESPGAASSPVSGPSAESSVASSPGTVSGPGVASSPGGVSSPGATTTVAIDSATAQSTAITHAGVDASTVIISACYLDYDDGRQGYNVDFYSGGYKYEYYIDPNTGSVMKSERELARNDSSGTGASVSVSTAQSTALSRVTGATSANIVEWKFDYDDGRAEYEGKIIYDNVKYEFTMDASTGNIYEWSQEAVRIQ